MVMKRPQLSDRCADIRCGHAFEWHYQVFGGDNAGCIVAWAGDTSDAPPCQCKGFTLRYCAKAPS